MRGSFLLPCSVKDIFHERTWLKASIYDVDVSRDTLVLVSSFVEKGVVCLMLISFRQC